MQKLPPPAPRPTGEVILPERESSPLTKISQRLAVAIGLVVVVALAAYLGRDGYVDPVDGSVSLLDAFYYSTVTITTTGYGDILPESDGARLVTTIVVTPLRVLFLILLVGTTLELLAERTRRAYRLRIWRRRLRDHVIICGYGSKARAAVKTLVARGNGRDQMVAIDTDPEARRRAGEDGLSVIAGSAATAGVLEQAGIRHARAVVVAPNRDDTAVLITLTARELNPDATIASAVREEENVHLLHQSGATSVITSSSAAGRLLGHAIETPRLTEVLEDLISVGQGLDIAEHVVSAEEAGPLIAMSIADPVIAVIRDEQIHRFDAREVQEVQAGDRIISLRSHG